METIKPGSSCHGDCHEDIAQLLEVFGPALSLEDIKSAYSKANHDVDSAGGILFELQGKTSMNCGSKDEPNAAFKSSQELSSVDASSSSVKDGNLTSLVASNTVSGDAGAEYARSTLAKIGSSSNQPSGLHSNTASSSNTMKDSNTMRGDVEDFLFQMLGDGFQLEKEVIHDVIGLCGYNLEKSVEALVDKAALCLEKNDDVVSKAAESSQEYLKNDLYSCPGKPNLPDSSLRSLNQNKRPSLKKTKNKNLEKEILSSLFTSSPRVEVQPRRLLNPQTGVRRSRAFGKPVIEPLTDTEIEQTFVAVKPLVEEDEEGENSYKVLREAVRECWATMKEYYKAATEAFAEGDHAKANELVKKGQFYSTKAREADEKSVQKVLETSNEEMSVDLKTLEPRQALDLLKLNLSNLAGIPSVPFLKILVVADRKSKQKRRVLKFLEMESIKWSEEDGGSTIVIRLDEIDPRTLNFTNQ